MASKIFTGSIITIIILAIIITVLLVVLTSSSTETSQNVQAVAVGYPTLDGAEYGTSPGLISLLYSYNGTSWYEGAGSNFNYTIDNPETTSGQYIGGGVAYGNGKWVATGYNASNDINIIYSNDGINWNNANRYDGLSIFYNGESTTSNQRGQKVAYGNGRWVATGKSEPNDNSNILYSNDGISWYTATMTDGTSIFYGVSTVDGGKGIAYGNGRWVAVGHSDTDEGNILYSDNGISWQRAEMNNGTSPFINGVGDSSGLNVIYNSGSNLWMAVGHTSDYNNLLVSHNGISWAVQNSTLEGSSFFASGCYDIHYSAEKNAYIATGSNAGDEEENLAYSNNGIGWDAVNFADDTFPFTGAVNGLTVNYSNNLDLWFATGGATTGQSGGALLTSSNGTNWNTTIMSDGISYPYGTCYGGTPTCFDLAVRN